MFKVLAETLAVTPPPVKYLNVKVVFEGAIPYVFVYKKFEGEYAVVNLSCSNGKPIPTLLGFGVISSVVSVGEPAPNWICKFVKDVKRVANLLATFFNFNKNWLLLNLL